MYSNTLPRTYTADWPGDGGTSATATVTEWPDGHRTYTMGHDYGFVDVAPRNKNRGTLRKVPTIPYHFPARPVNHDVAAHLRFKRMI